VEWWCGVWYIKERNEEEIYQYVCEVSVGWSSLFLCNVCSKMCWLLL
jgi:hypothetical protein